MDERRIRKLILKIKFKLIQNCIWKERSVDLMDRTSWNCSRSFLGNVGGLVNNKIGCPVLKSYHRVDHRVLKGIPFVALTFILFPSDLFLMFATLSSATLSSSFSKFGLYMEHFCILLYGNDQTKSSKSHTLKVFERSFMPIKSLVYLLLWLPKILNRTP